jgi:hypothetical protein
MRLASTISFSNHGNPANAVPCCGGFVFQDVNLTGADIQEVDLANSQVNSGRVDAFLTTPDCAALFAGPYMGFPAQPLCKVFIGPVPAGTVSERQSLPKGTYRLFAQAWATNDSSNSFELEAGLYSNKCNPNLTGPSQ